MKCAYEAANGVEAHMVANMLEQQRIDTRIDGEHLASGVGELPAMGLVRVMVDEERYDHAREIIREWEKTSPADGASAAVSRSNALAWFALGMIVGAALMNWMAHL
jgi:hypothetical protein